jgi:hypothetical protein
MALAHHVFKKIESYLKPNIRILEFGDQTLWRGDCCGCSANWGEGHYVKDVFPKLRITSLDISGRGGSLVVDLSKPVPEYLLDKYDLITNFGTSEHVQNQYQLWKNVFDMLKLNGLIINDLPVKGSWPNHCKYYVTDTTFSSMKQDFEIVEAHMDHWQGQGDLHLSVLKKIHDDEFKTSEKTLLDNLYIVEDFVDSMGF